MRASLLQLAAAAAVILDCASAGIGYSTLRLNPCGTSSAVQPYQLWTYNNQVLQVASQQGELWGGHAGVASLGPTVQNATLWATPGGNLALSMTANSQSRITVNNGALCVSVLGLAAPGAQLWLQPCNAGDNTQLFTYSTSAQTLTHVSTGMCVDAGSKVAPCGAGSPGANMPFCNASLPLPVRVADIVSRLSVEEKQNMLDTSSGGAPALGIAPIQVWNEALHGVANNVGVGFVDPTPASTSFPMAITSSMSFNTSLWNAIGAAISDEARAFSNAGHAGLTYWTPTINMPRDSRWGRLQETPGEDPVVSGAYATQYVKGMQEGVDPRYLKTSSCCKHFAAYSEEQWNGTDRHHFDAIVRAADLANYYFPAFQACVEQGRASAIMCSYNSVNGVPSCANGFLLNTVLREQWGFNGYVTSDCGAVSDIQYTHAYTQNSDQTAAATLKNGMDIGCDDYLVHANTISTALADGAITTADLDRALTNMFSVRMRLGEFDPPAMQPYLQIPPSVICSAANIELARDGARQSIVLLSNPKGAVPINQGAMKSVAVVGPLADNTYIYGGPNYNGIACPNAANTIRTALQTGTSLTVNYAQGCDVDCTNNGGFPTAVQAAQGSDFTIVVVGIDANYENEGLDRVNIDLPGMQNQLVQQTCAASKGPCILVVVSGGAQDVSAILPSVSAAYYLGLPGMTGAAAFLDLLFGAAVPAGRMTQTTYPADYINQVSLFDMNLAPGPSAWPPGTNPGRTYMYYTGQPVFPFGFGLSYTTFTVSVGGPAALSLQPVHEYLQAHSDHGAAFAPLESPKLADYVVNVTNTGTISAPYVVLGFITPPGAGQNGVPLQQLFGFQRVFVPAGQTVTVYIGLNARHLTLVRDAPEMEVTHPHALKAQRVAVPGAYTVRVGVKAEGQEWAEMRVQVAE